MESILFPFSSSTQDLPGGILGGGALIFGGRPGGGPGGIPGGLPGGGPGGNILGGLLLGVGPLGAGGLNSMGGRPSGGPAPKTATPLRYANGEVILQLFSGTLLETAHQEVIQELLQLLQRY